MYIHIYIIQASAANEMNYLKLPTSLAYFCPDKMTDQAD